MPKIVDIEPVFESNINDFQEQSSVDNNKEEEEEKEKNE